MPQIYLPKPSALAAHTTSAPRPRNAFVAAFLASLVAQGAKVFTHFYVAREWDLSKLVSSGGMPSSHTALVVGLAAAADVMQGTASPVLAISTVFALIVMYDAAGVRQHAGKQASVLNMIITELPPDHPVSSVGGMVRLKEMIGHTPLQVAVGALVGAVVGYIVGLLYTLVGAA